MSLLRTTANRQARTQGIETDKGRAIAKSLGTAAHFLRLDVTSEDDWIAAIKDTAATFGTLHVLVNSADVGLSKTVEDIELEE